MGRIQVLDDLLVNKIAAGEVIERPASVVKELVENAIDAGATHIAVAVEAGGRKLIRVADDGVGMSADDLRLAVTPHATSKIRHEDDLAAIGTLGFRGEALPSIGSVSQLRIVSRPADQTAGHVIAMAGDRIDGPEVTGCGPGTTIEVRELFFNVPARQKFLKGASTEMGHVVEQVMRTALAHPEIDFGVTHNGRETHRLLAVDNVQRRLGDLFSHELAEDLIPIERDERGLRISGWLAPPSRARSSTKWQYVFLNGRYIRDRFVQHAIKEAHRGLIDGNNQAVLFLFLTVDPAAVDVNVHPTKIEVRWRESGLVHSQVLSALRDTLLSRDLTTPARVDGGMLDDGSPRADARRQAIRREMAAFFKNVQPPEVPAQRGGESSTRYRPSTPRSEPTFGVERSGGVRSAADHDALYRPAEPRSTVSPVPDDATERQPASASRAIQLHNTYLVAETADGLVIVDQHALHERVLYDEFCRRITAGPLESQRLLLPETVEATESQMALLETHDGLLGRLGFDAAPFGRNSVAIHAAPSLLPDTKVAEFFAELLDKLSELEAVPEAEESLHTVLDMMACKAAVKAGDPLTPEEIDSLLRRGADVEKGTNCPHGRPTTLRLSVNDLEKQFHRI